MLWIDYEERILEKSTLTGHIKQSSCSVEYLVSFNESMAELGQRRIRMYQKILRQGLEGLGRHDCSHPAGSWHI